MEPIIYILIGIVLSLWLFAVVYTVKRYLDSRFAALQAAQDSFFVESKNELAQYCDYLLAKREIKPQDIVQPVVQATTEPPFWKNKQELKKAKEKIENETDPIMSVGPFAGMSTMDAFHEIDSALQDLNNVEVVE